MLRILHVIPSVSRVHGGPSHAMELMESALVDAGAGVTTVTTDDDGVGRRYAVNPSQTAPGIHRLYFRKWTEFYKFAPGVFYWIMRHARDFDVIHVHALFSFTSLAAGLAARLRGVPYIVRPLGTLNAYGVKQRRPWLKSVSIRLFERPLLANAAAVHFTSRAECDEARATGIPMRAVIVPLGVRPPESNDRLELPFRADADRKIVLFLSRLDPKKNVEGLLQAFSRVRRSFPDALLVIAGGGAPAYVRGLKDLAAKLAIDDATIWTGHIDGRAKWGALMRADVFVLPSFSENFGIAVAEAIVAGRPCVVGRGVALAEAVAKAGAGLVTDPVPDDIADKIERLLGDEALRDQCGMAAAALAEEFSPTAMAGSLLEVYQSCASVRTKN